MAVLVLMATVANAAVLEIALDGLPAQLDPVRVTTLTEWTLLLNLGRRLLGDGVTGTIEPGLALRWKFSRDQRTVDFTLDPAATFSSGAPILASDVEATFRYHMAKGGCTKVDLASAIRSMKVVGDHRLRIEFTRAAASVMVLLNVADLSIVPASLLPVGSSEWTWDSWSVTSGDYRISKREPGKITLSKNSNSGHSGHAQVEIVERNSNPDQSAWFEASPQRLIRIPYFGSREIQAQYSQVLSDPFWVRLAFFGKSSRFGDILQRRGIQTELRSLIQGGVQNDAHWDLILPLIRVRPLYEELGNAIISNNPTGASPSLDKTSAISIVLSDVTFGAEQKAAFDLLLHERFPGAKTEWMASPKAFLERIRTTPFDLAVSQATFAVADPAPVLNFIKGAYLAGTLTEEQADLYRRLDLTGSQKERAEILEHLERSFETQANLISLGHLPASAQYHCKAVLFADQVPFRGDLLFRQFQPVNR